MTLKRSAKKTHVSSAKRIRTDIVRQLIAVALLRSISEQGATNAQAARWMGVSERTLYGWIHCERPISVEVVLACRQLGKKFRIALCAHGHESLAYIARRRSKRSA